MNKSLMYLTLAGPKTAIRGLCPESVPISNHYNVFETRSEFITLMYFGLHLGTD